MAHPMSRQVARKVLVLSTGVATIFIMFHGCLKGFVTIN